MSNATNKVLNTTSTVVVENVKKNSAVVANNLKSKISNTISNLVAKGDFYVLNVILIGISVILLLVFLYYLGLYILLRQKIYILNDTMTKKFSGNSNRKSKY